MTTTQTGPSRPDQAPATGRHLSTLRSLARLAGYARPAMPAMTLSAVTAAVATGFGLLFPLVIGAIIDGPVRHGDPGGLVWWGLALLVLGVGEAGLFFVRRMIIARPAMRVEARMRADLYGKLQRLPVAFHDRWPAGQLLSRAISDLATIRRFVSFALIFLFVNVTTFVIGVVILLVISWPLGLIVAALALPLILVSFVFESRYRVLSRKTQDQVGDLATVVEESVLGIRILKAFGQSRHFAREFLRQATVLKDTEITKARVLAWLWAAIVALPEAALGLTLLLGIRQVADGTLTTGALVAFFGVAMTLRWPVDSIGWLLALTNETAAATERYFEVMDAPETIRSAAAGGTVSGADGAGGASRTPGPDTFTDAQTATEPGAAHLRFADVRFSFGDAPPGAPPVLDGLTLELGRGETVALVGATGSGKTTLTALVNRLHDVTGGAILLDGVDIRLLPLTELRRRVAVAFEDPTLFSASVRENVAMGLGSDATEGTYDDVPGGAGSVDDAVARALRVAHAEFVYDLPWGLATRIGEQGLSLSGGQRQRLALARAIVSRPEVLVLDDPLSALDIHTEAAVEQALRSVLGGTTALIVAHRASTVMLADRVALLADGRIAAIGPHTELMATVPAYRYLLASAEPEVPRPTDRGGKGVTP